jgi:hypothetical protein
MPSAGANVERHSRAISLFAILALRQFALGKRS